MGLEADEFDFRFVDSFFQSGDIFLGQVQVGGGDEEVGRVFEGVQPECEGFLYGVDCFLQVVRGGKRGGGFGGLGGGGISFNGVVPPVDGEAAGEAAELDVLDVGADLRGGEGLGEVDAVDEVGALLGVPVEDAVVVFVGVDIGVVVLVEVAGAFGEVEQFDVEVVVCSEDVVWLLPVGLGLGRGEFPEFFLDRGDVFFDVSEQGLGDDFSIAGMVSVRFQRVWKRRKRSEWLISVLPLRKAEACMRWTIFFQRRSET